MDKQSLTKVYEENAKVVYKYLFCLTHNSDLSEELTQETFYQATKGFDSFRGDCKISVWLCQIAKRLWYKEIEKQKKATVPLDDLENEIHSKEDIEYDFQLKDDKLQLFKKLHMFDENTREVIYLRLTGELSFKEIGSVMGKTETWARVTFYRGKQKLVEERENNG